MFDFVAKHKRILQLILALTLVPFAFFGLESYTRSLGSAQNVASVDGTPITLREFDDEFRRQQDRLREVLGRGADAAQLDTPELRRAVIESMISQRLVLAEVIRAHLAIAKPDVVAAILATPEFQEGGKFSSERYSQYLRARGISDEGNVAQLQVEVPAGRLAAAISGSAFLPRTVAERLVVLQGERREVAEAYLPADRFRDKVKLDDAGIKAYFEANRGDFRVPERVRAEYLVLSAAELGKNEVASEAELKDAYARRASGLAVAEQRRASHILVKTREEAERIAAEARKDPKRFAELAKKYSQDTGSAENGGDLGMNARGSLAAKSLEDAIFRMKVGEVAGPVQSEFGYHVILLTGIQAGKVAPFDELKKDLAAEIVKQKGEKKFTEVADAFNNLVYEQSDSLKPAAERYKLKIQTSDWLTRQAGPEQGVLAHPKLVAALFSPDSLQQRRNTDAVEVAPGVLVAARVVEHQAEKQRTLEEVRAEVERRLALHEAAALARQEGTAMLALLAKGGDAGLIWGAAKEVSRADAQGLPPAALRKVMTLPAARLPAYAGLEDGERGYAIYRVSKVVPGEYKAAKDAEEVAALDRSSGAAQVDAYIASLRARAKIEINAANLEKK